MSVITGLVSDMPEADYHSSPGLSSTGAKTLLKSPALYAWEREHPRTSDAFDLGSVTHGMVLGTGWPVEIIPGPWTTNVAKAAVAAAREAGVVPIKPDDYTRARTMATAVFAHPVAHVLLERGESELSAFWTDDATGVPCRARFDRLTATASRSLIVDLKTAQDANPRSFGRTAVNYGYHLSSAWYLDGHAVVTGDDSAAFLHVLVEKEPPHLVSVVQLDDDAIALGRRMAARAREVWRDCTEADVWPGYSLDVEPVSLPAWAYYSEDY